MIGLKTCSSTGTHTPVTRKYTRTLSMTGAIFMSKKKLSLTMSAYRHYGYLTVQSCNKVTLTLDNSCIDINVNPICD